MTASDEGAPEIERVIAFIRSQVPPPRRDVISADTDLRMDLRMIWEDAEILMRSFFTSFSVSPGDFQIAHYFPLEGSLLTALLCGFARRKPVQTAPLTVGMLAAALRAKEWRSADLEQR